MAPKKPDGGGANKIEPVLVYGPAGADMEWDWSLAGVGATNLRIRTSNGLSPHLFPEYITDREYFYAAGARPGFMSRFVVGESTVFAPYWPTSPNGFGGQIGASYNGDLPGDLYRFIGGVVVRDQGQTPAYAGYLASGAAGLQVDLPTTSRFPAAAPLVVHGTSSAAAVRYALIMPGAVLEQGDVPVVNGSFTLTLRPEDLHATMPIYDVSYDGSPRLGRVPHLTFISEESAPDGSRFWDFHRVVVRGETAVSAMPLH